MFFVIPIRMKPRRGYPTASAVVFALFGLAMVVGGIVLLASGPTCGGETMREGDRCVYREEGSLDVDHTNTRSDEERSNLITGGLCLAIGAGSLLYAPVIKRRVERHNAQLRRSRSAPVGPSAAGAPAPSAYADQIARYAHQVQHPAPVPPPPAAGPAPHHDL